MINLEQVKFSYKKTTGPALLDISIDIPKGIGVMVMGGSGAGKSTLLYLLNGLIPNFYDGELSGTVKVLDQDVTQRKVQQMALDVGMVFQDFDSQLFSTNVALEVAFGPENFGIKREEIFLRVEHCLQMVGLKGYEMDMPSTLSGGQKQRLAIAAVLSIKPSILCMDEPTTDLDPLGKEEIFGITRNLIEEGKSTVIIAEHETELALAMDQVILFREGHLIAKGPAPEILRQLELLRSARIMPLQISELFEYSGLCLLPLTVDEAMMYSPILRRNQKDDAYIKLVQSDHFRKQQYGEVVIETENLRMKYDNKEVLKGINFSLRKGEMVALLGQNGSGKTTFIKNLNALLFPTEGVVKVNGNSSKELGLFNVGQYVGFVFQNPDHQIFSETVFEEIAFSLKMRNIDPKELNDRVTQALQAVGLEGYEDMDPFSLTKGERQRVAVASILATKPDVMILDEPTTGLDYVEQRSMMEMICSLNEAGHTILIVTHTMWVVAEYAHRVVVLHEGNILLDGPVREVLQEEKLLECAHLKAPQITQFGNRIGCPVLSVKEALEIWNMEAIGSELSAISS